MTYGFSKNRKFRRRRLLLLLQLERPTAPLVRVRATIFTQIGFIQSRAVPFHIENLRTSLHWPYTNYGTGYRSQDHAILQCVICGRVDQAL